MITLSTLVLIPSIPTTSDFTTNQYTYGIDSSSLSLFDSNWFQYSLYHSKYWTIVSIATVNIYYHYHPFYLDSSLKWVDALDQSFYLSLPFYWPCNQHN